MDQCCSVLDEEFPKRDRGGSAQQCMTPGGSPGRALLLLERLHQPLSRRKILHRRRRLRGGGGVHRQLPGGLRSIRGGNVIDIGLLGDGLPDVDHVGCMAEGTKAYSVPCVSTRIRDVISRE